MSHKILTPKLVGSFMIILMLGMALSPFTNTVYAQTSSNSTNVSTKGAVAESSNFHGMIMWTIINGDKGTIILQSPVGRAIIHVAITPSTTCDSSMPICLFSTVIDAGDNGVLKVGDTARFAFDLDAKKETVSLLSGTLAGFDVSVDLSKTWSKTTAPSTNTTTNSTSIANPASVYCVNHGGTLDIQTTSAGQTGICKFPNGSQCEEWSYLRGECSPSTTSSNSTASSGTINSTSTNYAPKHLTLSLNESVGIAIKN
ncbi:Protein of unknown function DUF333 [Nitrosotalea devaniterrae]|uniref:DUF333 domain-containing protein n=1 Tax=Nitrosotalea devaniterrae TaxID=1078905 RepID=A0A128A483_9ARCH|nr:Protein of unknown function DUF333 [Candidatus Nitrosotalea devanaterra]